MPLTIGHSLIYDLLKFASGYMEVAREIEAAVEADKVTKEDAEKRLVEMRKHMFKQDDAKDRDREAICPLRQWKEELEIYVL